MNFITRAAWILLAVNIASCGSSGKSSSATQNSEVPPTVTLPAKDTSKLPDVNSIGVWRDNNKFTLEFSESLQNVRVRYSLDAECDLTKNSVCAIEAIINGVRFEHNISSEIKNIYYRLSTSTAQSKSFVLRIGGYVDGEYLSELSTAYFNGRVWENYGYGLLSTDVNIEWKSIPSQGFPQRPSGKLISFNNKLWLIGGYDNSIHQPFGPDYIWPTNAIYSSVDGIQWVMEKEHAEFPAYPEYRVVEFKNQLWLFGGRLDYRRHTPPSDFKGGWVSSNGLQWSLLAGELPFDSLSVINTVVWHNQLWVLVANGKAVDIWISLDGKQWSKQSAPEVSAEESTQLLVLADQLLLFSPRQISGHLSTWHYKDNSWQEHPLPNFLWSTYKHRLIPFHDSLVISFENAVFLARSQDGVNWQLNSSTPVVLGPISRYKDRFVMYTGKVFPTPEKPAILQSADGLHWSELAVDLPIEPREDSTFLTQDDRLWLFGGVDYDRNTVGGLWYSDDGKSWQRDNVDLDASDVPPEECVYPWENSNSQAVQLNCFADASLKARIAFTSSVVGGRPLFFKSNAIAFTTSMASATMPFSLDVFDAEPNQSSNYFRLLLVDGSAVQKRQHIVLDKLKSVFKPVNKNGRLAGLEYSLEKDDQPVCLTSTNGVDWQRQVTDLPTEFEYGGDLIVSQGQFLMYAVMNWGALTSFGDGFKDDFRSTALLSSEDCTHWKIEHKRTFEPAGIKMAVNGYYYNFGGIGGVSRSLDGRLWQRGYNLFERP